MYHMCSEDQIRKLALWAKKILQEATNPYAVVMLLGNNDYTDTAMRAQLRSVVEQIHTEHSPQSDKFIFAECNLNTGSQLQDAMLRLA